MMANDKYLNLNGLNYFYKRICGKIDEHLAYYIRTTAEWNADRNLVSKPHTMYIYSDYKTMTKGGITYNIPGAKLGDGNAYVIDLPFIAMDDGAIQSHINDPSLHVSASDRTRWDNKVSCFLNPENQEIVVFSND